MPLVVGVDGGGSTVRVVVASETLIPLGESSGGTVNPGIVGREAAAERIRAAVTDALEQANVSADQIAAAGIGVAGAAKEHSEAWLYDVLTPILPLSLIVPSNDLEIALVGARGQRRGVVILAGTGSAAYGVNDAGESALVGGWGYLLGDEGSGYWIGMDGLRQVARAADGIPDDASEAEAARLTALLLDALNLSQPRDLIGWLYRSETPRNREIAALAPLVLHAAETGSALARNTIHQAAARLAALGTAAASRLNIDPPAFAFAGGLLESPNLLSRQVCELLRLSAFPERRYSSVVGAALLALLHLNKPE